MPESGTSGSVRVEPREGLLYSTTGKKFRYMHLIVSSKTVSFKRSEKKLMSADSPHSISLTSHIYGDVRSSNAAILRRLSLPRPYSCNVKDLLW